MCNLLEGGVLREGSELLPFNNLYNECVAVSSVSLSSMSCSSNLIAPEQGISGTELQLFCQKCR